jgi:hypothetical protein
MAEFVVENWLWLPAAATIMVLFFADRWNSHRHRHH